MHTLSEAARRLLDRMNSDRCYEMPDLRALSPGAGAETVGEMMQELWVNRHVERVGIAAWRRHRSTAPHARPAPEPLRETKVVTPEELFDHDTFADFFR